MTAAITRAEINAFGQRIQAHLLDGDETILTDIGACSPSTDCDVPSCVAAVSGMVGKQSHTFTGHAVHLEDAIRLARGKLRDARQRHTAELAKAKAEKVSA